MTDAELEKQWRIELESAGEAAIRAEIALRGGIVTGGEAGRLFAVRWLREREQQRESRACQSDRYLRLTFWVAVATLVAAIVGVVATVLHP
jgi:hypothetical protein